MFLNEGIKFPYLERTTGVVKLRNLLCMIVLIVIAVPGMLEYESIPGVSSSKPFGGRSKAHADITVKSITKMVSYFTRKKVSVFRENAA